MEKPAISDYLETGELCASCGSDVVLACVEDESLALECDCGGYLVA